jgi:hypothetical protein
MSSNETWRQQILIRVCAHGHSAITYIAKRTQPEPPCPVCGRVQQQRTEP